ncbi:hypothetical protein EGW08_003129 [Elysia chlorotica]|uniref:guanylate cyclase n=1 Tax=Elysia chlorotica TaxID=188477 RepID=A0A3S0ZYE6_ELYCH|nr:hypothetical protein EGW08_003129 [Elysia chlorotica]
MADGSRDAQFMLHNLQGGCYVPIARSATTCPTSVDPSADLVTRCIVTREPADNQRISLQRQENSRAWIIHIDDLKVRGRSRSHISSSYMASRTSFSTESSLGQSFTEMYIYKGEDVAGKTIVIPMSKNQYGPASKRISSKGGAKQAEGQAAESVPSGAGGATKQTQVGIATTLSSGAAGGRPGLMITKPFTKEVNHGLRQLHHSLVGHHGRLKSSNVLVDNRWTCKLAHMMVPSLASPEYPNELDEDINFSSFLFTPPEVLRQPTLGIPGTKAADMFAYAIILMEILTAAYKTVRC